ncbi:MAG: hypothetical protein HXX16_03720 [Bacteroidales bacterium]|nr:hypothetical protein [Bacteroidales bacterium]
MNGRTPSYYRARLDTFRYFLHEELPGHPVYDTSQKNSPLELLKQGFVHPDLKERFESRIASFAKLGIKVSDAPLTFTETCSFNTWFAMHHEKVAGKETITSSINFPLTIKGTKEEIINTVSKGLQDDKQKRIRIAQVKAAVKLKLLQLVELSGTGEPIKIGVRDAKRWVKQGNMFFVVRSWVREGHIKNKIHEPKGDPYTKYIQVGNGSLILDLDNYTLLWQE